MHMDKNGSSISLTDWWEMCVQCSTNIPHSLPIINGYRFIAVPCFCWWLVNHIETNQHYSDYYAFTKWSSQIGDFDLVSIVKAALLFSTIVTCDWITWCCPYCHGNHGSLATRHTTQTNNCPKMNSWSLKF